MVRGVKERGGYEYTRSYTDIDGVVLGGTGARVPRNHLAYSENMYRDYEGDGGGVIESVPGYRKILDLGEKIKRIALQKGKSEDFIIVIAGMNVYRFRKAMRDSIGAPEPIATLHMEGGAVFSFGSDLFIADGDRMLKIDDEGRVTEVDGDSAYIPTTYLNGERFEDRNILTDMAREEHIMTDPRNYIHGSDCLKYTILDEDMRTCAVSGVNYKPIGRVSIPSTKLINGKRYQVKEVKRKALYYLSEMTELVIGEGVEILGVQACRYCKKLSAVYLPRTLRYLESGAFAEDTGLKTLYLGLDTKVIGSDPFIGTTQEIEIHYGGNTDMFEEIDGKEEFASYNIICDSEWKSALVWLPVDEKAKEAVELKLGDKTLEFEPIYKDGYLTGIVTEAEGVWDSTSDFLLTVRLDTHTTNLGYPDRESVDMRQAIYNMRVAELFDGRVFLSGNESLPNTIIYSGRKRSGEETPLYFGSLAYMNDGVGKYGVTSMLAVRDSLAVFKSGDDGTGSIFYHGMRETGDEFIPKVYPVEYVHSGIGSIGKSVSFFDDPVFMTRSGLYGLNQKAINYERSVSSRSQNVNFDLLKRDLAHASLTEWLGYLVLGIGDTVYLADSRARYKQDNGSIEYEWFVLRGIGGYKNSTRVYRYDSYCRGEYIANDRPGEVAEGEVYSVTLDGEKIYYVENGGKKYTVYPTEEERGGEFSPATCYLGDGELLFFGDAIGGVYVFNNDKRGVAPTRLSLMKDFDPQAYKERMGQRIHPDFYAFDKHAPRYAIKTAYDNCDIPHLTKSTIRHSLVIKCRAFSNSEITVEVGTDKGVYRELTSFPALEFSFDELNFESVVFEPFEYSTLPIAEKEKNWIEKQITVYSDKFASPIGIYSIAYRYMVKGRIKKE